MRTPAARPRLTMRPWWQHAVAAVLLGTTVWSAADQVWHVAIVSLLILAVVAMLLARESRDDHLLPTSWDIAIMTGVLCLVPIACCLTPWVPCATTVAGWAIGIISFISLRVDEKRNRQRLAKQFAPTNAKR